MLKIALTVSITLAALILAVSGHSQSTRKTKVDSQSTPSRVKFRESPEAIEGKYVVRLENNVSRSRIGEVAKTLTQTYGGEIEYVYTDVLKGFAVKV